MNDWFYERYIKEVPIEEQIRGQVRAECHYMDKADIYEWIAQNEIKIMNLQSKIDKVNKILNANTHVENIYHALCNLFDEEYQYEIDNEELNKILKEDK